MGRSCWAASISGSPKPSPSLAAIRQEDARCAFVLDDVHDSAFHGIQTEAVSATPPFSVQSNCNGVDVRMKKSTGKILPVAKEQ